MNSYRLIHIFATIKSIFFNIFGSKYTLVILDTIITIIISIHTSKIDNQSQEWMNKLYMYVAISILINILCIWSDHMNKKRKLLLEYFSVAYEIHNKINSNTSTKLFRVNKKVTEAIKSNYLEKGAISLIADFQTLSFDICNELHQFIIDYFDCKDCEITIFQRFKDTSNKDFVTMIAYRNSQNIQPSTYGKNFYLSKKKNIPVFVNIFKDANAEIKILHNKKKVKAEFQYFDNSKSRELEIRQYIGVPIRTNRNIVEILIQIDVSHNRVFGRSYKTVKKFTDDIIIPFRNLLCCAYERDLVLNKFYDVLEENIANKNEVSK